MTAVIRTAPLLLLFALCACAAPPSSSSLPPSPPPASPPASPPSSSASHATEPPRRVLFVGNSYLYYNNSVHNHVRRMAAAAGPYPKAELKYKSATIGGATLAHHNLDHLLEPGRIGVDEPFDLVILQGASFETLSPEARTAFAESAARMDAKVRAAGARTALYMTHAYVAPHKRFAPGLTGTIAESYTSVGRELGATVIPVGLAFERAYSERPDLELHHADGSHPSPLGTYLAACVVYATIYGRPAAEVSFDAAVPADIAGFLRRIADRTVAAFRDR